MAPILMVSSFYSQLLPVLVQSTSLGVVDDHQADYKAGRSCASRFFLRPVTLKERIKDRETALRSWKPRSKRGAQRYSIRNYFKYNTG